VPLKDLRKSALIIAHPGHEILLYHWLECARPRVFMLTDGSGGEAKPRVGHSQHLIEQAGATCGRVFGAHPDRTWYRAILEGDHWPFLDALNRVEEECVAAGLRKLVCDPVELFNPLHDLANAFAHALAGRLRGRCGEPVEVRTYPIEDSPRFEARASSPLLLNADAMERKRRAMAAYAPLAHEQPRYAHLLAKDHELIARDAPAFPWPAMLSETPYYESFGRARLSEGRYDSLITYADHVRPIALGLLEESRLAA
jgi:hypothetical protein